MRAILRTAPAPPPVRSTAAAGFAWLTHLGSHTAYWSGIAGPLLLFGPGIGVAFTPVTIAAKPFRPRSAASPPVSSIPCAALAALTAAGGAALYLPGHPALSPALPRAEPT